MRGPLAHWTLAAFAMTAVAVVQSRAITAQGPELPADISSLLTKVAGFSQTDLTTLQSGRVITRTDASPENLEASVVSAVRIATTKERTLDYFHLLASYVDGQVTVGYGTFGASPSQSDLSRLTLDASDVTDLRNCEITECTIRIGAATVAEIYQAVDWDAPDAVNRATEWARRGLASYAADFLKRGDAALVAYDDRAAPVNLREHWRSMIARSSALATLAPGLERYLENFAGAAAPPEVTEALYWDKQRLTGLKPIVGLTHLITWRDPAQPDRAMVVQRQIFASHYLYGSLAMTLVLQDKKDVDPPATYVVYFNRSRGDLLRGTQASNETGLRARMSSLGASLQRRLGEELVRQSADRLLSAMKQALER